MERETQIKHSEIRSSRKRTLLKNMAAGRRSSDPKKLLLVDPSQPEATKRARRHLTKRQKDVFVQYGFSKALLNEVIAAGWDQADINNYVLYFNNTVDASHAVFAPDLDVSMKKAINATIRTKLQDQDKETGLLTPLNPKGASTGDPPEPNLGMLPPGPRKTIGGTGLNPGQRSGSIKQLQAERR